MSDSIRAIAIMGATATGKSSLAIALAFEQGGEVISMDSRQVYRGFDIGTGKVTRDELSMVPHHLIDVADPSEVWSAGRHAAAAEEAIRDIHARGRVAILAGGTGLYFRALFGGLVDVTIPADEVARIRAAFEGVETRELHERLRRVDPARADELSVNDRVRITRALELFIYTGVPASELYARQSDRTSDIEYLKLVLSLPRELLRERIAERTKELFEAGWAEEVERLLAAGVSADSPAMNSLGYGAIASALQRGETPTSIVDGLIRETQQYAKRQETFFRSERDAVWIDVSEKAWDSRVRERVVAFLRPEEGVGEAE
ncbi:MAG TPA: tRNA (adenosine(37)-N6)-dimethylallyltransferase MiaA [Candidatus Krumholzibacteria bacterium]|nr:tRNA (adenosine(37)-N6)-dimethylallyltransferase MiaA [Candidatus Krumholzibacteria bacterium]